MVAYGPDEWPRPREWQHDKEYLLIIDGRDNPVIQAGDDGAVHISIPGADHAWGIVIAPTAFAPVMAAIGDAIGR
jgi:hypothetical protein